MLSNAVNTTVVMLTWNALDFVKVTINSLLNSKEKFKFIIFDNGSDSEVVNYLKHLQTSNSKIEILFSKQNIGVWNARYMAASRVTTEYICLIDSDLYFPSIWLTPMEEMIKNPSVGQVGPLKLSKRLTHPYTTKLNFKELWKACETETLDPLEQLSKFTLGKDFETFVSDLINTNDSPIDIEIPTRSIGGCISLTKTSLLLDKSLNDPFYGNQKYGMEDIDYSWSLYNNGYKVQQCTSVYVHHFEHSSMENNRIKIDSQGDLLNKDLLNYIYFVKKWEDFINNWIQKKLTERFSKEEILKDDLLNLLIKKIPDQIPLSIKRTLNF